MIRALKTLKARIENNSEDKVEDGTLKVLIKGLKKRKIKNRMWKMKNCKVRKPGRNERKKSPQKDRKRKGKINMRK